MRVETTAEMGAALDRLVVAAGGGAGFMEWSANYAPGEPSDAPPQSEILLQKKRLKDFITGFEFARMLRFTGFDGVAREPSQSAGAWATAIAEPGRQYALYLSNSYAVVTSADWYNGFYAPAPGRHRDNLGIAAEWRELKEGYYVPEGRMFPMGDNRDNSHDARYFGPVRLEKVLGKALFRYWPLYRLGGVR